MELPKGLFSNVLLPMLTGIAEQANKLEYVTMRYHFADFPMEVNGKAPAPERIEMPPPDGSGLWAICEVTHFGGCAMVTWVKKEPPNFELLQQIAATTDERIDGFFEAMAARGDTEPPPPPVGTGLIDAEFDEPGGESEVFTSTEPAPKTPEEELAERIEKRAVGTAGPPASSYPGYAQPTQVRTR